jgi:endonuclease YncB( thermonuclease family)
VSKPSQFNDWPESLPVMYGPYRAVVDRVVDGDTVYMLISPGFNVYTYESIRIMGIDAPELYRGTEEERERGKAAKEYLESIAPVGTQCVIRTDKDRTSFGRYSASILLASGVDVASEMVEAGMATWSEW